MTRSKARGRAHPGTRFVGLAVWAAASVVLLLPLTSSSSGLSASDWSTYHRDNARTGLDPLEPTVSTTPPLAWDSAVDGQIYAEPLVVGGRVFIATENNTVYAFDEATGDPAQGWAAPVHLGSPVPGSSLGGPDCSNIDPVGITSTPVIDTATDLLYTVALVRDPSIHYLMAAIDVTNGSIRFQRSIDPPGLNPVQQLQRPALALLGGEIYIGFGSRGDCLPYNGWIVGASASNAATPLEYYIVGNGPSEPAVGGAIWAPSGIAVDAAGFLYVASGNAGTTQFDHGDSVIRLARNPLREDSYFAPSDWQYLAAVDWDLGSVAPTLLNDGLIFQVGKMQVGYLLRASALGGIGGELYQGSVCGNGAFGGTAYQAPYVFVSCQTTGLERLSIDPVGLQFQIDWYGGGSDSAPAIGPPIIAGGLVWAVDNATSELQAFRFDNGQPAFAPIALASFGTPTHFSTLAAANGRLFVPAGDRVAAFSLEGTPPTPTPSGQTVLLGDNAIEPTADGSSVGVAEANQFTATASGAATSLAIYVDAGSTSTRFSLGLYADAAGVPGSLLAQGTATTVQSGWNSVTIPATALAAGTRYWIARLSLAGGDLVTRVNTNLPNPDRGDPRFNASLPATFSPGGSWPHRTSMYALGAGGPTPTPPTPTPPTPTPPTPPPGQTVVLGDGTIEPTADGSGVGVAEANQFTASVSGAATSLSIYVDPSNRSTRFSLGLYADAAGVPGNLMAQGTTTSVQNGWNGLTIPATTLAAGTPYWIARLSLAGGDLVTRVNASLPNPDRGDTRTNAGLPATFSPGGSWPHRTSMYAATAGGPTPTPPTPTPPTPTPPTPPPGATTVTFDDLGNPDRGLNAQYAGIDWGSGSWYLSGPWGQFTTNSISFPDNAPVSASFGFVTPRILQSVDVFNGGTTASTITLSCTGDPTVTRSVAAGQRLTITTSWPASCMTVTVGSTNGWFTNFDTLIYR